MRKLKLQMQMTIDGFVSGPNGEMDWMWASGGEQGNDDIQKGIEIADSCDTILMGRKMVPGFVSYWEDVADNKPESPYHGMAQRMANLNKIVFSRTQTEMAGRNLRVENGDLATAVQALKAQPGKDIIAYGGVEFATSLVNLDLVDEFYFSINPVAIGKGRSIFTEQKVLKLESSVTLKSGEVLNKYVRV
jgi:dihydrofolate reductase